MDLWLNILIGCLVVGLMGVVSIKAKIVSTSGLIAGAVVGMIVWIFGGWAWFILILIFHLSAAAFTKVKYERKARQGLAQEKGGARAWQNVMANGGFPTLCAANRRHSRSAFYRLHSRYLSLWVHWRHCHHVC